jgi:hypothetical protein
MKHQLPSTIEAIENFETPDAKIDQPDALIWPTHGSFFHGTLLNHLSTTHVFV